MLADLRLFLPLNLHLLLHTSSLLAGRAFFGFDNLQLAGELLFFVQDELIAFGEFRKLLLQCGGLFGALLCFGLHGGEFFAGHDCFRSAVLKPLVQSL